MRNYQSHAISLANIEVVICMMSCSQVMLLEAKIGFVFKLLERTAKWVWCGLLMIAKAASIMPDKPSHASCT